MTALTPREIECLALVAKGLFDGEIAAELGIQVKTAKNSLSYAYRKLGAKSRTQACVKAWKLGLIPLPEGPQ